MEWKPISTAPDDTDVICMDTYGDVFNAKHVEHFDEGWIWLQYDSDVVSPKYWLCEVPTRPTIRNR